MPKFRFPVTDSFLETCGSHSLRGALWKHLSEEKEIRWEKAEIVLEFHQSTRIQLDINGGPRPLLISEFTIPCLLEDILRLQVLGVKISVCYSTEV